MAAALCTNKGCWNSLGRGSKSSFLVLSHSARYVSNTISDAIVVARWVYNVLIERENLPRPAGDARDVLSCWYTTSVAYDGLWASTPRLPLPASQALFSPAMFSDPMLFYLEACKFVLFESHKNKERNWISVRWAIQHITWAAWVIYDLLHIFHPSVRIQHHENSTLASWAAPACELDAS